MNTLRSSAVWFSVNVTLLVMYLALASPPLLPVSFVDTLLIKLLITYEVAFWTSIAGDTFVLLV